jgi:transcriptional regulator with XRE-family HTH domain
MGEGLDGIPDKDRKKIEEYYLEFGKYLRRLRTAQNLSTRDVGELIGVSGVFISRIERGQKQASDQNLIKLAQIYKVPPDDLLSRALRIDHKMQILLIECPFAYDLFRDLAHDGLPLDLKEELFQEFYFLYEEKKKKKDFN